MAKEFYTLKSNFAREEVINDLESMVWTDRFYTVGDFELVVPLTTANVSRYSLKKRIARNDSKEVMTIERQEIKDNTLTLKGKSLLNCAAKRVSGRDWPVAGGVAGYVAYNSFCSNDLKGVSNSGGYRTQLDIGDLTLSGLGGHLAPALPIVGDWSFGPTVTYSAGPEESLLEVLERLTNAAAMGARIYLNSADDLGNYVLYFEAYLGKDRRITQSTNAPIQLSEQNGDIQNVSAVKSNEKYLDLLVVFAPHLLGTNPSGPVLGYPECTVSMTQNRAIVSPVNQILDIDAQFKVIQRNDLDLTNFVSTSALQDELKKTAYEEIDKWGGVDLVDFELANPLNVKYGTDYSLGDLITIDTNFAGTRSARITEYIYAQDKTGEREYPTIEIIP